ncbi:aspartate--tRNA ligase [Candidatus Parcubacteria bacterium]|nr:MAG: aspartate--tRNA ligase [Candidatus Parcubacteria bacterium]
MQSNRIFIKETPHHIGKKIVVKGWVRNRRNHGKIIFIDLIDKDDIPLQVVFTPGIKEYYELASKLRGEDVIKIEGLIKERPSGMQNDKIPTGKIELESETIELLNKSRESLPIPIDNDGYDINEELRLKNRYLDLRRQRLHKNIKLRHAILHFIRNYLSDREFLEIETPILTKSTPEGARDYVVPSRLQQGKFYALPQSPQQYKQLLMVAGFERYFQIARCFRDEDTRGDRQPEFTQLDLELSFVEREDVMKLVEDLLIDIVKKITPEKTIQEIPFPRLTHKEVISKYKTENPDLRKDKTNPNLLAFCWITDFPFFEKNKEGEWTFTHNPFSTPIPQHREWLLKKDKINEIITSQYDVVLNGFEIGGGSIRSHTKESLEAVFEILGHNKESIKEKFGHMLDSFTVGAPPHGGIAWGLDRLVAILTNEPNIREVIAFPKTGDARDPMMGSPSEIDKKQLKELGIKTDK